MSIIVVERRHKIQKRSSLSTIFIIVVVAQKKKKKKRKETLNDHRHERERERDKKEMKKKKSNKKRALFESLLQKIVSKVSLLFSKTIEIETRFSRHTKEEED
jgi:hypothetical protein